MTKQSEFLQILSETKQIALREGIDAAVDKLLRSEVNVLLICNLIANMEDIRIDEAREYLRDRIGYLINKRDRIITKEFMAILQENQIYDLTDDSSEGEL